LSLFDTPKRILNPIIWTPDLHVKSEVKNYIHDLLTKIYPTSKIDSLVLIGSNVGHQYSEKSDIDVAVIATKGELFDTWHSVFKKFNETPNLYPGTLHPINFFFQENHKSQGEEDWSNSLGAYDLFENRWLKKPIPYDKLGNPEDKYARILQYGNMILFRIEMELNVIQSLLSQNKTEEAHNRMYSLAILFKQLEDDRKTAYKYGIGTPALQEANIIYKLVTSRYDELSHALIQLFDDDWKLTKSAGAIKDNLNYGWYVTKHKANIVSPMLQMQLPLTQALVHDFSKYLPSEFRPYRDWFQGPHGLKGDQDKETHKQWREAVEKHYARNMHHWKKRGLTVAETPLKYRMESVADWYSVGKTNRPKGTKFPDFKTWYAQRQESLPIDNEVRFTINKRLGLEK